ncbi:MAG TPA: GMC family oxidoreductase [Gemmataceae bacterium]|nr:GMC family oxidoreductase [Gemmataceae bacterium]
MQYDCDVLVIGSGAGGGVLAYACAKAGKSVLLLERGSPSFVANEQDTLIGKNPYDDRTIHVNGADRRVYMGGVLGGSTALFGGALLRPSHADFHPGRSYGERIPRHTWDWPIDYDDLARHYDHAERLFGVAGDRDEDYRPIEKPAAAYPHEPLPLHPVNVKLMASSRSDGLRPFRLPLAIDPQRCLRCAACAGYVCPTGARGSTAQLLQDAQARGWSLAVRTGVEVEKILLQRREADGVEVRDRASGERQVLRARRYVLAAGAIGSAHLVLRSGAAEPLAGRHYMYHLAPLAVGVFASPHGAEETFVKQVGFADYYFGDKNYGHKLGVVQSLPVPGPLMLARMAPYVPGMILRFLRRRMLPIMGIVEDLPNPENRVTVGPDGGPRLQHRFGAYDLERGKHLGTLMARILKRAGALFCVSKASPSVEHVAHQCGTLRFGNDPAHSVLDRDCRMHRHPNVFIVDGSFFPTSLGVGPALTISANALRVADVVAKEV